MSQVKSRFTPRPYQQPIMRKFLLESVKRHLIIAHRRSGKDTLSFQMLWIAAMMRPGLYYHLLPKIGQSSSVIWHGRGKDGTSFLDYIPKQLVRQVNNSTMTITLVNGSRIKITGADNYEALIGSNPLGIVFSEIQSTDPRAWDYLRPVLAENEGWAVFIGTPRGHNHLYDMYQKNKDNENWQVKVLTVDDTKDWDGNPVVTPEMVDEERQAGMPEELIQQEFYCSFQAAIQGAYFAKQMQHLRNENKLGAFEIDTNLLVFTAWDLGISDSMAIGFFQAKPNKEVICFEHIEETGEGIEFYLDKLRQIKEKYGFKKYGMHFVPHDIRVRELGTGRTRFEIMQRAGMNLRIVPRMSVQERIQCGRTLLPDMRIHKRCSRLIRCLDEYHSKTNDKTGTSTGPNHNWASHCFTGDTKILTRNGTCPIIDLPDYGEVMTLWGWRKYRNPRVTRKNASLVEVLFRDGTKVKCTPDHLFFTDSGWKSAKDLTRGMRIRSSSTAKTNFLRGIFTKFGQKITTFLEMMEKTGQKTGSIGLFGLQHLETFPKIAISTTKTETSMITGYAILSLWMQKSTLALRQKNALQKAISTPLATRRCEKHRSGTSQKKAKNGTKNTIKKERESHKTISGFGKNVFGATKKCMHWCAKKMSKGFAMLTAKPIIIDSVKEMSHREDVWCLTVPGAHHFSLSNGAIVHNSADMFTYFAAGYMDAYDPNRMAKVTSYAKLYPLG